jgi:hypothetical protein
MTRTQKGFWYVENDRGGIEGETPVGPRADRTPLDAIWRAQGLADDTGRVHTVFEGSGTLEHEVSVLPNARSWS